MPDTLTGDTWAETSEESLHPADYGCFDPLDGTVGSLYFQSFSKVVFEAIDGNSATPAIFDWVDKKAVLFPAIGVATVLPSGVNAKRIECDSELGADGCAVVRFFDTAAKTATPSRIALIRSDGAWMSENAFGPNERILEIGPSDSSGTRSVCLHRQNSHDNGRFLRNGSLVSLPEGKEVSYAALADSQLLPNGGKIIPFLDPESQGTGWSKARNSESMEVGFLAPGSKEVRTIGVPLNPDDRAETAKAMLVSGIVTSLGSDGAYVLDSAGEWTHIMPPDGRNARFLRMEHLDSSGVRILATLRFEPDEGKEKDVIDDRVWSNGAWIPRTNGNKSKISRVLPIWGSLWLTDNDSLTDRSKYAMLGCDDRWIEVPLPDGEEYIDEIYRFSNGGLPSYLKCKLSSGRVGILGEDGQWIAYRFKKSFFSVSDDFGESVVITVEQGEEPCPCSLSESSADMVGELTRKRTRNALS